ncbi:MAG: hypothetical protein JJE09_03290 [Bacteroidia bacterium]|nr:hypothetical protein [Bacteroidia bacterium]
MFALVVVSTVGYSQDFNKNMASARTAYGEGKLEDARFAMEQMLRDLDIAIGNEIMKMLPVKLGALNYNLKEDNVTGGSGSITGLFVHRTYGLSPKSGNIEIMNNSPMIASLSLMLSNPIMGGMMTDENQKQIKVQGYKSLLRKNVNSETGTTSYELQVPMNNTLVTVRMDDTNEGEITTIANSIPLSKIAQLAQ